MQSWQTAWDASVAMDTFIRLSMAIVAGAVIGWERERRYKPAGLRTHMLVSLGAAAFMIGALELIREIGEQSGNLRMDPIRALAGIIGGIGFLGAGTIIQSRGSVHGITTAASIWIAAAIGTNCGMGRFQVAATCGILTVVVLWAVRFVEYWILHSKNTHRTLDDSRQQPDRQ